MGHMLGLTSLKCFYLKSKILTYFEIFDIFCLLFTVDLPGQNTVLFTGFSGQALITEIICYNPHPVHY